MNTGISADSFSVTFHLPEADVRAVDGVSVQFQEGKITGLIGESGCGKSVLGLALLGLLPPYASTEGTLSLDGQVLTSALSRKKLGTEIGLIPQNPSDSLNPARTVMAQLQEALLPLRLSGKHRNEKARELLVSFGFSDPERILKAYPHELSGGMQQRVLCALGAACSPRWILADEPTKGLDRDLLVQVEDTLLSLKQYGVKSMVIITHDLPLAHALCDSLAVMYAGQILESGSGVLENPLHPYTRVFLDALPGKRLPEHPGQSAQSGRTPPRLSLCSQMPLCHRAVQKKKASGCQPGAWKNREVLSICLI